jgi:hypothetical protein
MMMGGTGSAYVGEYCIGWERGHLEDPGADGRMLLKRLLRVWMGAMDWIDIAQNRDRWQALVNAVMNHEVT